MFTETITPSAEPSLVTMPKERHLTVVPDIPKPKLIKVEPKPQVKLHPKGCRCDCHNPQRPWSIPQSHKGPFLLPGPKLVAWDVENWQDTHS
jgi:hypothetical protein